MTNYERFKSMLTEEMVIEFIYENFDNANFKDLYKIINNEICDLPLKVFDVEDDEAIQKHCSECGHCRGCVAKWLRKEVE